VGADARGPDGERSQFLADAVFPAVAAIVSRDPDLTEDLRLEAAGISVIATNDPEP
jgi:hypothetical protein